MMFTLHGSRLATAAAVAAAIALASSQTQAQPGRSLAERCPNSVAGFTSSPSPKALAQASNGRCGWAWSRQGMQAAKARAILECQARGGINCRITHSR